MMHFNAHMDTAHNCWNLFAAFAQFTVFAQSVGRLSLFFACCTRTPDTLILTDSCQQNNWFTKAADKALNDGLWTLGHLDTWTLDRWITLLSRWILRPKYIFKFQRKENYSLSFLYGKNHRRDFTRFIKNQLFPKFTKKPAPPLHCLLN